MRLNSPTGIEFLPDGRATAPASSGANPAANGRQMKTGTLNLLQPRIPDIFSSHCENSHPGAPRCPSPPHFLFSLASKKESRNLPLKTGKHFFANYIFKRQRMILCRGNFLASKLPPPPPPLCWSRRRPCIGVISGWTLHGLHPRGAVKQLRSRKKRTREKHWT